MIGISPRLPLAKNGDGGYNLIQTIKDLATQNLKMIVLTSPGERVMDIEFGVGIRSFLFMNNTSNFGPLRNRIMSQTQKYLSWVTIEKVDIFTGEQDHSLVVNIYYSSPSMGLGREVLSIPIN